MNTAVGKKVCFTEIYFDINIKLYFYILNAISQMRETNAKFISWLNN